MGVPAFGGRYVPGSAIAPAASFALLSPVAGFAAFHIANTVFVIKTRTKSIYTPLLPSITIGNKDVTDYKCYLKKGTDLDFSYNTRQD